MNLKTFRKYAVSNSIKSYYRKKRNEIESKKILNLINDFFLREDVSRPSTSAKATKTIGKIKYPKQFLNDLLINLFNKFQSEYPDINIRYDLFIKSKPKYILIPKLKDREKCPCKIHENFYLMALRLKQLRLIFSTDPNVLLKTVLCNEPIKNLLLQFMYQLQNQFSF